MKPFILGFTLWEQNVADLQNQLLGFYDIPIEKN